MWAAAVSAVTHTAHTLGAFSPTTPHQDDKARPTSSESRDPSPAPSTRPCRCLFQSTLRSDKFAGYVHSPAGGSPSPGAIPLFAGSCPHCPTAPGRGGPRRWAAWVCCALHISCCVMWASGFPSVPVSSSIIEGHEGQWDSVGGVGKSEHGMESAADGPLGPRVRAQCVSCARWSWPGSELRAGLSGLRGSSPSLSPFRPGRVLASPTPALPTGHTGRLLRALLVFSLLFLAAHFAFQICLYTVPHLDQLLGPSCESARIGKGVPGGANWRAWGGWRGEREPLQPCGASVSVSSGRSACPASPGLA